MRQVEGGSDARDPHHSCHRLDRVWADAAQGSEEHGRLTLSHKCSRRFRRLLVIIASGSTGTGVRLTRVRFSL